VSIRPLKPALVVVAAALLTLAAGRDDSFSPTRMAADIQYLASDDLGGRSPGSPGEAKVLAYLTGQLETMGAAPGNPDGTYLQTVPLFGYEVTNAPTLRVRSTDGSDETQFASGSEFVAWTLRQADHAEVRDAGLVFVGYGVVAPEYQWNDYKTDVRDKIVVMLVNDPPTPKDDPTFAGEAMTYYGRWTYKFEEAAARGAAGAILIHNTERAGYPWEVVENSWSGEQFDVVRTDHGESRCAFESWITEGAARKLFAAAGMSFDAAVASAASSDFEPVDLGLTASTAIRNRTRTLESHNVLGLVEGSDPARKDEIVVYTAHWDHLGIGKAADGDSIYNGALDNASGVAGVLEIARAFVRDKKSLKRSVLVLFTTGEESGLLGATHYVNHPLYPLVKTVAEINVDGINIWGRTTDMVVVGYGQSNLDRMLADAIAPMGRQIAPDSEPEKGYYYRSDHFPFAKMGVPALYSDSGVEFRNRPSGWGMERRREFVTERYHKPQDEYDPSWDLSGAAEDMEALFRVGFALAGDDRTAEWSRTSEFRRVREQMLRGSK